MIPIHKIAETEQKEVKIVALLPSKVEEISEPHRHQFYECFVFLKGGGTHSIDFVDFPIQSNSIHIITPGQVHQVKRAAASEGFVFMFDLVHFSAIPAVESFLFDHSCFDTAEFPPYYHFDNEMAEQLKQISNSTWMEYSSSKQLKNLVVLNQLSILILLCMQINMQRNLNQKFKHNHTYSNFRKLLTTEFRSLKKVKEYASKLKISEKQLNETCLEKSGETASSLIYKQVILEAKRLLNTGIPSKEVAYDLNFLDPAHFSKFFKSQTGLSPSEFKNIHV
jgi:AraC-like DNA-binding protein/quercetin dioxygenase-like cupin family protein